MGVAELHGPGGRLRPSRHWAPNPNARPNVKADVQNRIRPVSVIETAGECQAKKEGDERMAFPSFLTQESRGGPFATLTSSIPWRGEDSLHWRTTSGTEREDVDSTVDISIMQDATGGTHPHSYP